MSEPSGLTTEMYRAVVSIVDDRMREIRVTRQDFDELKGVVSELVQAQARTEGRIDRLGRAVEELAQAQIRTEERVGGLEQATQELIQAQARIDASIRELAQAQARTEERVGGLERAMEELAEAQARTESVLQDLAQRVSPLEDLAQQVGRLSDLVGYGLEDIARVVLPGYLEREFGFRLESLRRRLFRLDGEVIDLDIYGEGEWDGQPAVLLGEVKARIYRREVERFLQRLTGVEPQIEGEVLRLMFGYFIDLSATEAAGDDVLLVASYEPTVRAHERRRQARHRQQ